MTSFFVKKGGLVVMTDDDAGGRGGGGKNGDFWMTSFVNDPLLRTEIWAIFSIFGSLFALVFTCQLILSYQL